MSDEISKSKIQITEPITVQDYEEILNLIEENLLKREISIEELQRSSAGELLVAKDADEIVGTLSMRRPGKIFKEIEDKYFDLEQLKVPKGKAGYIALVSVKGDQQGKGIGKMLVTKCLEYQKDWGAKAVIVHASQSSPGNGSEKLFSSFGFKATKLHKAPWFEYSKEKGPEGFWCNFCGNPCHCDELELVKYL